MKKFRAKFFGSKQRKEQIKQITLIVEAEEKGNIEDKLRYRYGYEVINGLKIREVEDE